MKTHSLSLYAANKTGRPVVKNTGWDLIVEPGDKSLEEMIKSVDKGLIMGGYSGGEPGTNGEFSGVAKNSFFIENGEVKYAVSETMVNGNLGEIVKNIRDISKEQICDGSSVVPYIAVSGVVISGK
ncbi:metallopeptidase TldD-related protein [Butyrivibrio fibrisolvens]|uniref:metallopeptidase TldD-related protein n=1 Tax=Butyrivibrio fibrisolvens TaxID=831 RepID=UPI0020BF34AC|nr:metallopeptidase TldD-related protein [Butyrivibrio fibrisolvens]